MKKTPILGMLTLGLFLTAPAMAHYTYMDPIGQQLVDIGDTISINVYAHADTEVDLEFWMLSIGFDQNELQWNGYTLNSAIWSDISFAPLAYKPGGSVTYAGFDAYQGIDGETPLGAHYDVTAGENVLLATINFTYLGGTWDGADVWVEFDPYWAEAVFWLDAGVNGSQNIGANGADFNTAAVPVPAAAWLLGSGLMGLVGLRRKTSRA